MNFGIFFSNHAIPKSKGMANEFRLSLRMGITVATLILAVRSDGDVTASVNRIPEYPLPSKSSI